MEILILIVALVVCAFALPARFDPAIQLKMRQEAKRRSSKPVE